MRRVGRLVRDLGLRARAARGARAPPPSAGGASRSAIRGAGGVRAAGDPLVGTPTARSSAAVVLSMGFAASSIVAAAIGVASMDDAAAQQQTAFGENVSVDPATLRRLAADIAGADPDDFGSVDVERRRARALRILARVTLFLDHHDAIVAVPEVTDALIQCLERGAVVAIDDDEDERHDTVGSASTADAIRCLADLAKEPAVREAICASPGALVALAAAMDLARWEPRRRTARKRASSSSPSAQLADVPSVGVVHATRLAAELAGDPTAHAAVIRANVPAAVVRAGTFVRGGALGAIRHRLGALTPRGFGRRRGGENDGEKDAEGKRRSESETTRNIRRNVAAFAYNLVSSSSVGREAFIATDGGVEWCRVRALARDDRVAHRYAVGALAVLAARSLLVAPRGENEPPGRLDPWSLRLAMEAAVKGGLESGDAQAACFACGMLRRVAREGDEPTRRFAASLGVVDALLRLLGSSSKASGGVAGWAAEEEVAGAPDASAAGRMRRRQRKGDDGARACALRALESFALVRPTTSELYRSVLKAKNRLAALSETADGGTNGGSASVRKLAADVLTALRA